MRLFVKKATLRKALLSTTIFTAFFVLINFTEVGVAGLLKITNGASILDFRFGYSAAEAHDMLTTLGEQGRSFYLQKIIPIDFPFPLASMLCYTGWIALLVKHTVPQSKAKHLLIIPFLAMLFDWMENLGIIFMLTGYPDIPVQAVTMASISGVLKALFTLGSLFAILVLLTGYLLKTRQRAQEEQI